MWNVEFRMSNLEFRMWDELNSPLDLLSPYLKGRLNQCANFIVNGGF